MVSDIVITPQLAPEQAALLNRHLQVLNRSLDNSSGSPQPIAHTGLLEQIGRVLWQASGLDAPELLHKIDTARETETPLRLVVTDEATYPQPWELLYHDHPQVGFVARLPWCVVTRRLRGDGQRQPRLLPRPMRLLLLTASPEDLDVRSQLDFEREEELLFSALDQSWSQGDLDIDVAEDGCLETLRERLAAQPYHAVILSMHGTPARNAKNEPEWGLLFEDARTGRGAPIAGSTLAALLDKLPTGHRPGLVVLSACRSARAEESADAISSVALHLHQGGFERVLGMRLSVLDGAASAFSAELFRRIAQGESVGRAVTLARDQVAAGGWLHANGQDAPGQADGDPFAQWTLPVLLDRTTDGPLVDLGAEVTTVARPPLPEALPGDGAIGLPPRASFIGRRWFIRQHLRAFLSGEARCLLLTGPGGVGKTTLAGVFARRLHERDRNVRLLGWRAPFDLQTVYDVLWHEAFDGTEEPALLPRVQTEADVRVQMRIMLQSMARRQRPCAFVLDNLEVLQDLRTLANAPEHEASLWLVQTICALPAPTRVLLTGRYGLQAFAAPAGITSCPVPDAPYGDVLRRMHRLHWPPAMSAVEKHHIYTVLGGNHRAIEWLAQVLLDQPEKGTDLMAALEGLAVPPNTPEAAARVVLEAMRHNLLLDTLRQQLSPEQDRLLCAASLFRVPVNADGLVAIAAQPDQVEADQRRLVAYALLETSHDPDLELPYFAVPPVVKELIGDSVFRPEERRALHQAMGQYHRFQGAHLSQRWSDDIEAIYHFRCAADHPAADELAEPVCGFYYQISNFAGAKSLTEEIVTRATPPAPWWALTRHGMCQRHLGFFDDALEAFEQALAIVTTPADRGATLNNLSGIYQARGDYETALGYLEQSLQIHQEIGDKAGEGTTLNNLSGIYRARGDYETALGYLEQSLQIHQEIGDKAGEGTTLNNLSQIYDARGDYETALGYLEQSLQIRQEIGDKAGMVPTLHNMAHIALTAQDVERALTLWSEALSLAIETQNAQGLFGVARDLGQLLAQADNKDQARQLLQLAVDVGRRAGFPGVDDIEAVLRQLS